MSKSNRVQPALCFVALLVLTLGVGLSARAAAPLPTPTPTPPLNTIKIGQCYSPSQLEDWIAYERAKGNVIDARPFAINQSTGQLFFSGNTGRFSVVHMNPFAYDYRITVAQEELVTTALTDFLKLLLPPSLSTVPGLQSGRAGAAGVSLATPARLAQIADRLDSLTPPQCNSSTPAAGKSEACVAAGAMFETYTKLRNSGLLGSVVGAAVVPPAFTTITASPLDLTAGGTTAALDAYTTYARAVTELRDEEADAYKTCQAATALNSSLAAYNFDAYFSRLDTAQQAVSDATALAQDLEQLVVLFKADAALKDAVPVIRCKGYICSDQFDAYAKAALDILGVYTREITALRENAVRMQRMYRLTQQMKNKEGLFARTNTIIKKFELSQAKISVARTRIDPSQQTGQTGQTQSGNPGGGNGNGGNPQPVLGNGGNDGAAPVNPGNNNQTSGNNQGGGNNQGQGSGGNSGGAAQGAGNNLAPAGQVNEVVQIGQPRFALSGGLVYSPLPRRTFTSVKGFARDAQGNPTGNGSADVVGFGENSSRRVLPMVMLNTRLTNFKPADLYFSWGVSAKNDGNFDIEYLFGPSVSLLNNRAFFTFGAYGGQTQNLVADVAVGDALPDTIGDAKLYRKSLIWKPGFSFSYSLSRPKKVNAAAAGTGATPAASSTPSDDLKSELRIGGIPFNLALGVAYTSLEQRTYDEVVGFARDRQGNLTNGRTLTRVVGLTSSSDYRMSPLVMLHSRLTNFGSHDFYFSTGITGKKTDNNFDIEYLLGGSLNLYRRKVFLTFGAFAGKQQILGGDFFEGAALGKTQNVTTQNRYVWKPAISFSYDITRILPRSQQ
jgi:hypothetical protein